MDLLRTDQPIALESAKLHLDREKEGPERRMMVLKLNIPIPGSGMYEGLPETFQRIHEGALRAQMAGSNGFKMASIDHEMKGQRLNIFELRSLEKPRCSIEFADLKNFKLCREEETGAFYLTLDCVFDYTNQNKQASTWAKDWIGAAFYWTGESIQQQLMPSDGGKGEQETPQAREQRKAKDRKKSGRGANHDDSD